MQSAAEDLDPNACSLRRKASYSLPSNGNSSLVSHISAESASQSRVFTLFHSCCQGFCSRKAAIGRPPPLANFTRDSLPPAAWEPTFRGMASGFGLTGAPGRCYPSWMDFSKCMETTDDPRKCFAYREDYLECLHHRKEFARLNQIYRERKKQLAAGVDVLKEEYKK